MATITPFLSANAFLSLGLESTRGTAAATPTYIPVETPTITPMIQWLKDSALRGSPVDVYDEVLGVRHDELDVKGKIYADSFPILLRAVLGSSDAKTGTGPTYNHVIGLANSASTGSQPPSVTGVIFDAANSFQSTAMQAQNLDISWKADGTLDWATKFIGNPWTVPSNPTSSWGTEPMMPAWDTSVTINSSALAYVESMDIKITRNTAAIFTAGQQSPASNFAGPIDVTGTMSAVVASNADPFTIGGSAYGLYRQQIPVVIVFTDPVTSHTVTLQMSTVQFEEPKRNVGKVYTSMDLNFTAIANTTDAVASGYSPIKTTTVNAVSTAYSGS